MMRYQMRKWIVYTSSLSSPKKNYPEPGLKRRTNTGCSSVISALKVLFRFDRNKG